MRNAERGGSEDQLPAIPCADRRGERRRVESEGGQGCGGRGEAAKLKIEASDGLTP